MAYENPKGEAAESTGARSPGVQYVDAGEGDDGQRLDNFLVRQLKDVPRTHVFRLLRKGEVRVNKKRAKPDQRVVLGDIVRIPPVRKAEDVPPTVTWGVSPDQAIAVTENVPTVASGATEPQRISIQEALEDLPIGHGDPIDGSGDRHVLARRRAARAPVVP